MQPSVGPVSNAAPASHSSQGSTIPSPQCVHSCPRFFGSQRSAFDELEPAGPHGCWPAFNVHVPCLHELLAQKPPHCPPSGNGVATHMLFTSQVADEHSESCGLGGTHAEPCGRWLSGGQASDDPSHTSGRSQLFTAGRHGVPLGCTLLGQVASVPVQ